MQGRTRISGLTAGKSHPDHRGWLGNSLVGLSSRSVSTMPADAPCVVRSETRRRDQSLGMRKDRQPIESTETSLDDLNPGDGAYAKVEHPLNSWNLVEILPVFDGQYLKFFTPVGDRLLFVRGAGEYVKYRVTSLLPPVARPHPASSHGSHTQCGHLLCGSFSYSTYSTRQD